MFNPRGKTGPGGGTGAGSRRRDRAGLSSRMAARVGPGLEWRHAARVPPEITGCYRVRSASVASSEPRGSALADPAADATVDIRLSACSFAVRFTPTAVSFPSTGRRPMNYRRILLGGLVAGVIITASEFLLNGVVLASQMQADLARHNLVMARWAMAAYVVMALLYGFALAWLYAAIRPRFGAGFGTGLIAAAIVWTLAYLLPSVSLLSMGASEGSSYVIALVWGAAELVIGAAVAGYLYKEGEAPAAQHVLTA